MEPKTLLDYMFVTFWRDFKEYVLAEEEFWKTLEDDRFTYFYDILKEKKCLPNVKAGLTKLTVKAVEFRKTGDQAFFEKNDISAVRWYTRSAAVALPGSAELASAFANRSAALYRMEAYTASLIDINRALLGRYPDKVSLESRKKNCVMKLQKFDPTISPFLSVMKNLAAALDPLQGRATSLPSNFEFDSEITDMNYEQRFPLPPENYPDPTEIPFTHKNVKVKYNTRFGRHIVAAEEIKPGETLGMEKPFASVLALKYKFSHCGNCFVRCEALIPCPTCALVMFCSEKCRDFAYDRYHRVECKILFNVHHFDMKDNVWLAVRMLMIVTKQGEKLETLMNHPTYKTPMKIDPSYIPFQFDTEDYLNIHNLEHNGAKTSFEDNYSLGFTAALIVHILKHSEFFDKKNESDEKKMSNISTDLSSEESYVGALLLKFLFIVKYNAFKVMETLRDDHNPVKTLNLEIGSNIYIFHSYFNHSCEENGAQCFHRDVIVSRSIQLVHVGEQIFLNYGMNYGKAPCDVRLRYLHHEYKFECKCQACTYNWPVLDGKNAAIWPKLKRKSIRPDSLKVLIGKTRDLRLMPSMSYDRPKFDLLCNSMETYHRSVKKPWKEYYECQEKLKEIYSTGANHYYRSADSILMFL